MTLYDLVLAMRQRLDDFGGDTAQSLWEADDSGCLWKNTEISAALAEAEREFCRRVPQRASGVTDINDELNIPLIQDQSDYAIDERVLTVRQVLLASSGRGLERKMLSEVAECPSLRTLSDIRYYLLDAAALTLTTLGVPAAADTLLVSVTRLPSAVLTWVNAAGAQDQDPMIRASRHMDLLHWAERLLYLKRDADTYDPAAAERAGARFTDAVGDPVDAHLEEWRLRHVGRRFRVRGQFF